MLIEDELVVVDMNEPKSPAGQIDQKCDRHDQHQSEQIGDAIDCNGTKRRSVLFATRVIPTASLSAGHKSAFLLVVQMAQSN